MATPDPVVLTHQEWLGYVQPTGLVVSAVALAQAGIVIDRGDAEGQELLRGAAPERQLGADGVLEPVVADFETFARAVLDWDLSPRRYAGGSAGPLPDTLIVDPPGQPGRLTPDLAVRTANDADTWQLLVRVLEPGTDPDRVTRGDDDLEASEHGRMERLLRATGVTAGLLCDGRALRLISAPVGESSGWLDFRMADMTVTAGRVICAAMRALLRQYRLFQGREDGRLPALLAGSRKYQNEVSDKLAEQVLHALYALLRGFQSADDHTRGDLLRIQLQEDPDEVYRGLLTVTLRLVFLLYAEERGMLPEGEDFTRGYGLAGLYERLREDAARHPDTMNARYGAWAQLLTLFRLVHDGSHFATLSMPARRGVLFDPNRFGFLEGRKATAGSAQVGERLDVPKVPDGTVYRVLEQLLVLNGERLSYRALDVEQIGSVYQTMMGFQLERATGWSVAVRPKARTGAPTAVDLEALLEIAPKDRAKRLTDMADPNLGVGHKAALKDATTLDELQAALGTRVDSAATPDRVPPGAMVLQPSDERRKSGSHYTPRELTGPIVRETLAPLLDAMRLPGGRPPLPSAILELKVCDPALGSGAFLVEACRQLAVALVEAWEVHGGRPPLPPDQDELLLARRTVAQRCLYGVDRNPVALDLAKLSLWLITLAKDHPLTFVDHTLRHGDALVGLRRRQIEAFHWNPSGVSGLESARTGAAVDQISRLRRAIREAGDDVREQDLRELWHEAEVATREVRAVGDLAVDGFFRGATARERDEIREQYRRELIAGGVAPFAERLEDMREASPPLVPFHWSLEFPEVFDRERPGFDAIVGNPPFAGTKTTADGSPKHYLDWLKQTHEGTHGNADLVAHFFRRGFSLLRHGGRLGLIATNTIGQGDTRGTGLRWICEHGGTIVRARKRVKWPGLAAVVVSVVWLLKGEVSGPVLLDGRQVKRLTAYLVERGGNDDPSRLAANDNMSFTGAKIYGQGFLFDDGKDDGSSSLHELEVLLSMNPQNREAIRPYIGGEEVNNHPRQAHHRFVINFGSRAEEDARARWPELMEIVESRVKPGRMNDNREAYRQYWWQYGEKRVALWSAIAPLERVLVTNAGAAPNFAVAFQPSDRVFAHSLAVFALDTYAAFAGLQARPHEVWARFFASSMKDDLRYTASDCFRTFPFPDCFANDPALESAGRAYEMFRAELMVANDEGLTRTYNRFHDPEERDGKILELRDRHAAMDRAVLEAYGWTDVPAACDFFLDYEVEDDEAGGRRRKKPYRYRWPDDVRDEVLARLIELNGVRAAEEQRAGVPA